MDAKQEKQAMFDFVTKGLEKSGYELNTKRTNRSIKEPTTPTLFTANNSQQETTIVLIHTYTPAIQPYIESIADTNHLSILFHMHDPQCLQLDYKGRLIPNHLEREYGTSIEGLEEGKVRQYFQPATKSTPKGIRYFQFKTLDHLHDKREKKEITKMRVKGLSPLEICAGIEKEDPQLIIRSQPRIKIELLYAFRDY